jgi:uncharacterized protein (DUF983 family)
MRREPNRTAAVAASRLHAPPSFWTGVSRGAMNRCPACGEGALFAGFLRLAPACSACGAPLGAIRADDAPPYFTIFLAGHLLLPGALWVEMAYQPPMWLHMAVWLPLFAIVCTLCTLLLRPVKGAVVGWMMRLGLTGSEHGGTATVAPNRNASPDAGTRGRAGHA